MKLKAFKDRIIVKRVAQIKKTASGIILTESEEGETVEGLVMSVGEVSYNSSGVFRKLDIKEGDRVLFNKYSGTPVESGGDSLIILSESEVVAVITG